MVAREPGLDAVENANNNVGSKNRGVRFRLSVDTDCKENLDSERMKSWCLRLYPVVIINIMGPDCSPGCNPIPPSWTAGILVTPAVLDGWGT